MGGWEGRTYVDVWVGRGKNWCSAVFSRAELVMRYKIGQPLILVDT